MRTEKANAQETRARRNMPNESKQTGQARLRGEEVRQAEKTQKRKNRESENARSKNIREEKIKKRKGNKRRIEAESGKPKVRVEGPG